MAHPDSILQPGNDRTCYLCGKLNHNFFCHNYLETHHIFGGPNRKISEMQGFKVKLCIAHHRTGPEAVHRNMKNMRLIQRDAQKAYENTHTRQQFMRLIGRNYLEEEDV